MKSLCSQTPTSPTSKREQKWGQSQKGLIEPPNTQNDDLRRLSTVKTCNLRAVMVASGTVGRRRNKSSVLGKLQVVKLNFITGTT